VATNKGDGELRVLKFGLNFGDNSRLDLVMG